MIGDNIDIDIKGAKDAGVKSILADYRNRYPSYENRITDIKELALFNLLTDDVINQLFCS